VRTINKADMDQRLARVGGQVQGLRKMVQDDRYCVDILTQIAAIRSALDRLGLMVLSAHLESCLLGQNSESAHEECREMSKEEMLEEVQFALSRFLK
jgi:CsoR family transcriptional regulator, copper-sensing transcriptional repressor